MRLSVRWQLVVVLVTLSLLPMAVTGVVAYRSARGALDQSIRFNLETLASQTEERLERLLLDRQLSLRGWSQLRLIQDDTVTADADGRILQFLQDAKRNFELQELWVASAAGQVIASTLPGLHGREVGEREWLHAARRGESWVGVPEMQEITGRVGMPIAMPLYASFDRSKTVGVIVAVIDWPKVVETLQSVKVLPEGQNERGYLLLADTRGLVLSAPSFVNGWEAGKTRLSSLGLERSGAAGGQVVDRQRDDRRARRVVPARVRLERAAAAVAGHLAGRAVAADGRGVCAAAQPDVDHPDSVGACWPRSPPAPPSTGPTPSRGRSCRSCPSCARSRRATCRAVFH